MPLRFEKNGLVSDCQFIKILISLPVKQKHEEAVGHYYRICSAFESSYTVYVMVGYNVNLNEQFPAVCYVVCFVQMKDAVSKSCTVIFVVQAFSFLNMVTEMHLNIACVLISLVY